MPRKIPTKKLNSRLMDKGGKIDRKYKNLKSKNRLFEKGILSRLFSALGIFLVLAGLFYGYEIYNRQNEVSSKLDSSIKQLDQDNCKKFNPNLVNTFLEIQVDDQENVTDAYLYIFSNSVRYSIQVNTFKFPIDNLGSEGTLKDLIQTNSLFLDKKSVFKYLSGYFYRNFYIKLDSVVITNRRHSLLEYYKVRQNSFIQNYFNKNLDLSYLFYTDLCLVDFNSMLKSFYLVPLGDEFGYSAETNIKSLFGLDEIKKEQIRIQISNGSGVEQWGFFMKKLFESYGLNVVKLDNAGSVTPNTSIAVDKEEIKTGQTLKMLNYLLNRTIETKDIKNQENIFSDIYVILGQDSIN